jgi:hypothetical protein
MKAIFFLLLIVIVSCKTQQANDLGCVLSTNFERSGLAIYEKTDILPVFDDKGMNFISYITSKHTKIDKFVSKYTINMLVKKNGKCEIYTINKRRLSDFSESEKDLFEIISQMPKWKPGYCNGKKVNTIFTFSFYLKYEI